MDEEKVQLEKQEKKKNKLGWLKTLFSVISILMMLAVPTLNIILKKGNLYVNIGVLLVSLIYGILWLRLGNKKAYKINRVYKWSRLFLSFISLSINVYSVYITAKNFNLLSVLMTGFMIFFWVLNVIYNILFDIASAKFEKFKVKAKENIGEVKEKVLAKKGEIISKIKSKNILTKKEEKEDIGERS